MERRVFRGDRKFLRLFINDLIKDDGHGVALDMGLRWIKTFTPDDKVALLPPPWEGDIPSDERREFLLTPLILETADTGGQIVYVAVVSAYIAEVADARSAIRTAEHLEHLTGYPARPVVAARFIGDRVDELVEAGRVFWHELTHKMFEKMEDPPETPEERALNDAATARLIGLKRQGKIP